MPCLGSHTFFVGYEITVHVTLYKYDVQVLYIQTHITGTVDQECFGVTKVTRAKRLMSQF